MKALLTIVSFFLMFCCLGQETLVRSNGDSIIVFDDGTWKLFTAQVELEKNTSLVDGVDAERVEDAMTGDIRISTPTWWQFGKSEIGGTLSGSLMYAMDMLLLNVSIDRDLGCLSKYSSKILVKLADDSIVEFSQLSDSDCSDAASARFVALTRDEMKGNDVGLVKSLNSERMETLLSHEWKMIRVHGSEYYSDYFPHAKRNADPSQFFMQHISAIKRKQ
jgi:hypothetical protein